MLTLSGSGFHRKATTIFFICSRCTETQICYVYVGNDFREREIEFLAMWMTFRVYMYVASP
jgi:hypothetical protein